MTRPTPLQAIHQLAAAALREPAPQTVKMADLPYVARHILRLLAGRIGISAQALRREIISEGDLTPALLTLVRHRLIQPVHISYCITEAGIYCVSDPALQKALPRTTAGAGVYQGVYQGVELLHRSSHTH